MNDRPEFGRRTENGDVVTCSPLVFSIGDFVDVACDVDISYRGSSGVSVHLAFSRVVQLATASEFPSVSNSPSSRLITISNGVMKDTVHSTPVQCPAPAYRRVTRPGFALKPSV